MARYTGPVCKLCRREGDKLFLKGERCASSKCAFERRETPPGQHGRNRRFKRSEYGVQLREKQKIKRIYGLQEKQFRNFYERAVRQKGITGQQLLMLLESRLDNIIYRMGLAPSRLAARMLVRHRHVEVNDRIVDIPSYILAPGDKIRIREKSRKMGSVHDAMKRVKEGKLVPYVQLDKALMEGVFVNFPTREAIPIRAQEQMVVELYSK
ncbi:30S ribosomal protein S4 [candidate division LCP-89 bacterium B3_LCP]|uniref:Small ribosomal subunit protein uS4 n=1 Tax=candidate division LCP-89 bacterium B3_LCP TaxID=2012998 RepID=A0A532UZL9_UNCL8|nr:MAG: 30S ribosomal protein S4 [candidate division LCP-89 bacterium B3_LCP]